jgi:S-adenosylmethionine:tRNA ribosyltransferase-isomerase
MNDTIFNLSSYDYSLPKELIAQEPLFPRSQHRLLIVNRRSGQISEGIFTEVKQFFQKGDCLVLNDTKVINARLFGKNDNQAKIELLLIKEKEPGIWEALVKPGKRAKPGAVVFFDHGVSAKILERTGEGTIVVKFSRPEIKPFLDEAGLSPLPNYIKKQVTDHDHYQTVYAKNEGAIAAPTAGFHFTPELLDELSAGGVKIVYFTLHCGLATFRPIKAADVREHKLPAEWMEFSKDCAQIVNQAKTEGKRVFAVGTTSIRALESAACPDETGRFLVKPYCGLTNIYINGDYKFKIVDAAITNFHTPCSTNLVLISTFCGRDLLKKSYSYAIENKFRFFSFGDAMIVI